MAVVYQCPSCSLRIILGPWHGYPTAEHNGGLYAACRSCGAQYHALSASGSRGPEFLEYVDLALTAISAGSRVSVMRRLRADLGMSQQEVTALLERLPAVIFRDVSDMSAVDLRLAYAQCGAELVTSNVRHEPNPNFGPIGRDRLERAAGPFVDHSEIEWVDITPASENAADAGVFPLEAQTCVQCRASHALVTDMNAPPDPCPRCRAASLEYAGGWIT